jgi:hypothetical protein
MPFAETRLPPRRSQITPLENLQSGTFFPRDFGNDSAQSQGFPTGGSSQITKTGPNTRATSATTIAVISDLRDSIYRIQSGT